MFNSSILLKALPSFWRDRFEDRTLLEKVYSFVGGYLGDTYAGLYRPLSALSIRSTPLYEPRTWGLIPLSSLDRLSVSADGTGAVSLVIYGLREQEYILNECSRLYAAPILGKEYLVATKDYKFINSEDAEFKDLVTISQNDMFFRRYKRYIVFFNVDPATYFDSYEPETPKAYYPLVFKVPSLELNTLDRDELLSRQIKITIDEQSTVSSILAIEIGADTTALILDPDCFSEFNDTDLVKIEGLSDEAIYSRPFYKYGQDITDTNIWAYDCSIDTLELFRRWGYLLDPQYLSKPPVRSTNSYKLVLEEILEARLRGLSAHKLERIASIIGGSDILEFGSSNDTLLALDLVEDKLVTQLTNYTLLKNAIINIAVIKSCQSVVTQFGKSRISGCLVFELTNTSTFQLLLKFYIERGPLAVTVEEAADQSLGKILLCATNKSIVVLPDGEASLPEDGIYIRYHSEQTIFIPNTDYTVYLLDKVDPIAEGTLVNPLVKVSDISTGIDSVATSGMLLPSTIWDAPEASRREINLTLTPFIIGQMSQYRIGDYELFIPTEELTYDYFDSISSANPNGYSWSTSYKLYSDFLKSKLVVLEATNNIGPYSKLDSAVNITKAIKDSSKLILTLNALSTVDYIPLPEDSLEVAIVKDLVEEPISIQSYSGIDENHKLTMLLSGISGVTYASSITSIRFDTTNDIFPVRLVGVDGDVILVEALVDDVNIYANLVANNSVELEVNSTYLPVPQVVLSTNHVGSDSLLMVVGASYPEYTSYYSYSQTTVSEWLQVEVEPPPPASELTDSGGSVTDTLETEIIIPVQQNLNDDIPMPQDDINAEEL